MNEFRTQIEAIKKAVKQKYDIELNNDEFLFYGILLLWFVLRSPILLSSSVMFFTVIIKVLILAIFTFVYFRIIEKLLRVKEPKTRNKIRTVSGLIFAIFLYLISCLIS